MTISATVPIENLEKVNELLEADGHGPANFSVPLRSDSQSSKASVVGLHSWDIPSFLVSLQNLSALGVEVTSTPGKMINFRGHCESKTLEWSDPSKWTENPVKEGDKVAHDGKQWESLMDYNVWTPPIGYREIVKEGYPDWVQPTGAHDAYGMGERVTHKGREWESANAANVWEPGVVQGLWAQVKSEDSPEIARR